jgi:hypothetical protein
LLQTQCFGKYLFPSSGELNLISHQSKFAFWLSVSFEVSGTSLEEADSLQNVVLCLRVVILEEE